MKIPRLALLFSLLCAAGSLAAQDQEDLKASPPGRAHFGPPIELRMKRAGSTTLDLRGSAGRTRSETHARRPSHP